MRPGGEIAALAVLDACIIPGVMGKEESGADESLESGPLEYPHFTRPRQRESRARLLHIDETSVSVRGFNGYVWVLASMEEVAYFFTPTREGNTIQELLKNFSGVLVTDFYAAYDAINCRQQKCLIHFIRDLNSAILEHPFDKGLKQLAGNFTGVLKPIIETVDRRGLKKRFLGKFRHSIDQFYKGLVDDEIGEAAGKLVERLQKNRNKMFTFLEFDGVHGITIMRSTQ